jgi:NADH-quinone oxidoreductase subunit N
MNTSDLLTILPLVILIVWATLLILVDLFISRERKELTAILAALGLVVTLVVLAVQGFAPRTAFNEMIVVDGFSSFINVVILGSGLVGIALSYDYLKREGVERGEYYYLLLFSMVGMMLMGMAADLIVVFLALELLSIPLYVLAGFARPRLDSEEASLKYFLLGAFATGFVVYGIALIFGAVGTTSLPAIVAALGGEAALLLFSVGAALILIGLGFKVAAVPFHMWTPDVYQGAPSSVTAFMAVGAKVGGFAALLRVFFTAFPPVAEDLTPVLWVVAALTMIVGNILAIAQSNIKRMLAYSSIAHAGYILMALVPYAQPELAQTAIASALFYLVAYALTNFAAWSVVIAVERVRPVQHQEDISAGELLRPRRGLERQAAAIGSGGTAPAGVVNAELQPVAVATLTQERPAVRTLAGPADLQVGAGPETDGGNGAVTGTGLLLDDYAGLARKAPLMAAVMAVAMLSFTGVPPTLGFVGKFYLFRTVLDGGFVGLALIGVITSLISAYYYLRLIVIMYMRDGEPQTRSETWLNLTALVTGVATVVLVIFSAPLFTWAAQAVMLLF